MLVCTTTPVALMTRRSVVADPGSASRAMVATASGASSPERARRWASTTDALTTSTPSRRTAEAKRASASSASVRGMLRRGSSLTRPSSQASLRGSSPCRTEPEAEPARKACVAPSQRPSLRGRWPEDAAKQAKAFRACEQGPCRTEPEAEPARPLAGRRGKRNTGHLLLSLRRIKWRRWTGIEPAKPRYSVSPVLRTGGPTRNPDTSVLHGSECWSIHQANTLSRMARFDRARPAAGASQAARFAPAPITSQ